MRYFLCIFLFMFSVYTYATEMQTHDRDSISQNIPKVEMVLTVTTSELIMTDEGISVNYDGKLLNVYFLERVGTLWEARVGSCANGHPLCCWYCQGCAVANCNYRCRGGCQPH